MMIPSRAEGFAICLDCRLRHPCLHYQDYTEFAARHPEHRVTYLNRDWLHEFHHSPLATWDPRKLIVWAQGIRDVWALRRAAREMWSYAGNADVKEAWENVAGVAMAVTALQSLANSATAGWQSAVVDNTASLYLDAMIQTVFDFANTAPANSKGVYLFAYHGYGSVYTNPASGSEATITLLDVTTTVQALPRLGFHPYTTQDEVSESRLMSVAATCDGVLPPKWGVVAMNHSGAALAASLNTVTRSGVFATVI